MKVGIPRAMGYFYYYPLYRVFLESLGVEPVVSPETNKKTLDSIVDCPTDEPCISVKLVFPHVKKLMDMGVDKVFLPVLVSGGKDSYFCPKHIGLPFMIKNSLGLSDNYLLSPRIDIRDCADGGRQSFIETAKNHFGVSSRKAQRAYKKAWLAQEEFVRYTSEKQIPTPEGFSLFDMCPRPGRSKPHNEDVIYNENTCTGIVAHSYTLYDYIGHNLADRLKEYGRILTPEMVSPEEANRCIREIYEGEKLWSFEIQMVGSAFKWLHSGAVDRLILLGPFECGPEAIIENFLEEECARHRVPFLILTVDEQTGEAGMVTRLEAFMDTSGMVKRSADNIHGRAKQFRPLPGEKLVAGIPSMGNLDKIISSIFGELGIETIVPPISRKTIELGLEISPEFICFPMVVTIGQMREALERGASAIFMVTGKARCRLGWYAQVQESLLKKAGYDFEMVSVGAPFPLRQNMGKFLKSIRRLTSQTQWIRVTGALRRGYQRAVLMDEAEKELLYRRAVELKRGGADSAYVAFTKNLYKAQTLAEIKKSFHLFIDEVTAMPAEEEATPYRVRVIGEIYAVLEDFVNMNVIKTLGSFPDKRIWVDREISSTNWFRQNILKDRTLLKRHSVIEKAAAPYINELVGGHGLESVGLSVLAPEENTDGIIHLFPFTCMPEIVAQNILTRVTAENEVPLLTVITNEQTGEAGIQTRLEAFMDILEERRREAGLIKN